MMVPKIVLHMLSGGLDSVVMLYWLIAQGCKVHCLLVDYGQLHIQELEFAKKHCTRNGILYTVVKVSQLRGSLLTDGKGTNVVPVRNAILLSHACNWAAVVGAESVTYACNKDDAENFPDCRPGFVTAFNDMLRASEIRVEVCAPFINKSKWEVGGIGRELAVPTKDTWSCYKGGVEPCGECEACKKREAALA